MNVELEYQEENTLQLRVSIANVPRGIRKCSSPYIINKVGEFMFSVFVGEQFFVFIRFSKRLQEDNLACTIKLTSKELRIANKNFKSDDGEWQLLHHCYSVPSSKSFDLIVHMYTDTSLLAALNADTELTDFELRGEDGSVRVHRAVLAAASPVLGRMLSGTWRETTEGRVEMPGTSKVTLQNLKDYVYLRTLPDNDNGLEPLLMLASCYMMKDLEQKCIDKIASSVTVENACDLLEMAIKHKESLPVLLPAILECFIAKSLFRELRRHILDSK